MTDESSELFDIFLPMFLEEVVDQLNEIGEILNLIHNNANEKKQIDSLFRFLHTIKGNSALCGLNNFSSLTHSLEDVVDLLRQGKILYSEEWFDIIQTGIELLKDAVQKIKENYSFDNQFICLDYKNKLQNFICSETDTSKKDVCNVQTKENIVFEEEEVDRYFLDNLTYQCYKAVIKMNDAEVMFADLKMAAFLNKFLSGNINVLRTLPSLDILGTQKYNSDLYNNELIILFEKTDDAKKYFEKVYNLNKSSINNYDLFEVNINDFLPSKRKILKDKSIFFQVIIISAGREKYAIVCKKIIKILQNDNIRYLEYGNRDFAFIRYLDKAVPVISMKNYKSDKILVFDTVSGIIGLFIDKIDSFNNANYSELMLNLEINDFIYKYNDENVKVLFMDNIQYL